MRDYLPAIHIRITGALRDFLMKMAEIAKRSGNFTVEAELDAFGFSGFDVANLRLINSHSHKGLGGQLIIQPEVKNIVAVEIRAEQWIPDDPPTYETYVKAAKGLVNPLLAKYNGEVGTRYRMTIPTKQKLEPRLPPKSAELFRFFAVLANKSSLHPLDWQRFYVFVRNSRMRQPLSDEDMERLLIKEGFSEDYARHIAGIYAHLWKFKQLM